MVTIIFKAILSSALFLLAYTLLLEKEKMHQFNRFYLLFSLVLSFVIPFVTIKTSVPVSIPIQDVLINAERLDPQVYSSQLVSTTETVNWYFILWTFYGIVTSVLLIRFVMNLKTIFDKIRHAAIIRYRNSKLVLTNEKIVPYSFLNYIFVNTEDFRNGNIEEEILLHELTHTRQKHTIDILLIELSQIAIWFNPFLILYRKAIQLNHEFLADEEVIHANHDVPAYQYLLVSKSRGQTNSVFTSSFNYLTTKKRLIMMTRTTSATIALAKQVASFLLFACAIIFLSSKTYAQTKADPIATPSSSGKSQSKQDSTRLSSPSKKDVKYIYNLKPFPYNSKDYKIVGQDDKYLYLVDSVKYYKFALLSPEKPLAKKSPTSTQLETWSDGNMHGVWLDGKRIANEELSKYRSTDFAHFFESRLTKNAKNYGKHYFQVNLMTKENYEEYLKNWKIGHSYVPDPDKTWEILETKNAVRGVSWYEVKDILETDSTNKMKFQ